MIGLISLDEIVFGTLPDTHSNPDFGYAFSVARYSSVRN